MARLVLFLTPLYTEDNFLHHDLNDINLDCDQENSPIKVGHSLFKYNKAHHVCNHSLVIV